MNWTRRDFLQASSLAALAGALPTPLLALSRTAAEFRALRRGVGIYSGRGGTIGWLIRPEGVVVVDSQFPETARSCLDGIRDRSDQAIAALINTHHHGDHTGGNGVFRPAVGEIVAHARAPELQREAARRSGTEDEQTYADATFAERWRMVVADESVRAKHYGAAHTGGDCTVFFENANVVHMGDLIFNRLYPFIDRPGGASVRGWIDLLEAVAAEHDADTAYIFGHGRPEFGVTGGRADVLLQRDFLSAVLEAAAQAVQSGSSRAEATRLDALPGFPDHVAPSERLSLPAVLGVAYDELTGS